MSIRVSELPSVTSVTDDDFLIVNDGNVNTSKISFADLSTELVRTDKDSTINGDLTLLGTLRPENIEFNQDLIYLDQDNSRVGILNKTPMHELDVNGNIHVRNGNTIRFGDATNSTAVTFQAKRNTVNSEYALPLEQPSRDGLLLACNMAGDMYWSGTMDDPMGQIGDIIYRDLNNTTTALSVGSPSQVLTVDLSGVPQWKNNPSGFTNPMSSPGDIITQGASNLPERLPLGSIGRVLTVNQAGTGVEWLPAPPSSAGGASSQVQWNLNGVLVGSDDFYYDSVTNTVHVERLSVDTEITLPNTDVATFRVIPPGSQYATGKRGQISVDDNYIYVCRQDNIWVRAVLASW